MPLPNLIDAKHRYQDRLVRALTTTPLLLFGPTGSGAAYEIPTQANLWLAVFRVINIKTAADTGTVNATATIVHTDELANDVTLGGGALLVKRGKELNAIPDGPYHLREDDTVNVSADVNGVLMISVHFEYLDDTP